METELISIIIPVYNIRNRLGHCMESLQKQTYPSEGIEIILVDDGSSDGSSSLCDYYASTMNMTTAIHQVNQGPGIARNTGLECAHGEYIMFIDGDDYLHIDALKTLYEAINLGDKFDISMCDRLETTNYDESTNFICETKITELTGHDMIMNIFYHKDRVFFYYLWNKLYRRQLLKDIHFGHHYLAEDFDFNFRILLHTKKVAWVHRSLYFYVRNQASLSSQGNWEQHYLNTLDILYKNLKDLPPEKKQYRHELLMRFYRGMQKIISITWNTPRHDYTINLCRRYEKYARWMYLTDSRFSLTERLKTTFKVCHPKLVAKLRNVRP